MPARLEFRFEISAAWHDANRGEFIWVVRWSGEGSFEDTEAAYGAWDGKPPLPAPADRFDFDY